MSGSDIIGRSEAWRHDGDGAYTTASVIVNVNDDTKNKGEVEIAFQIGTKREQAYLTVNAEELVLAVMRARSKK